MQGKILRGIGGFYYVADAVESAVYKCRARGIFRKENVKPLVGDLVEYEVLDETDMEGNVIRILPRRNELFRPALANVDQVLLVFAVTRPEPHLNLLDRFLVMLERRQVPVILCFNKKDLAAEEKLRRLEAVYRGAGHPVLFVSAAAGEGIPELERLLEGRTTAMAGPSGVGKSSLVNRLQAGVSMETGDISRKTQRGRHTTRHSELIRVSADTYLVDTPGFSSLYAEEFQKEELRAYFPEFREYEGQCRFLGCCHDKEPGCRVKEAVEEGRIHPDRYQSYLELYRELEEKEKRRY